MFAVILIAALLPIFIIVSILILIFDGPPVFFVQSRLGLNKVMFNCYKFRTMRADASQDQHSVWTLPNDERITSIGKYLRRYHLDELPQLFNIIKGDLSFIGPRPVRKFYADQWKTTIPYYDLRFTVRPGLSGWAQVKMQNYHEKTFDKNEIEFQKFEYELFYIENASIFLDLYIMIMTIRYILLGKGM